MRNNEYICAIITTYYLKLIFCNDDIEKVCAYAPCPFSHA